MKTIIIPDIHTRYKIAQNIIDNEQYDECILLGDYFDDFSDTPEINKETALWLKEYIQKDNQIALIGNHDLSYYKNKKLGYCSGYSDDKNNIINKILSNKDWNKLKICYYSQGYLFTHAGLNKKIIEHPIKGIEYNNIIKIINKKFKDYVYNYNNDPLFGAGIYRGGRNLYGGIIWNHFPHEFIPIENLNQIFGHTIQHKIVDGKVIITKPKKDNYKKSDNWCIDTCNKYYGIIIDGNFEYKRSK